jgi:hypothetical protein
MQAGVAQSGIISPVLFSVYVDMPSPSRYGEMLLYEDVTPVINTSVSQCCLSNTVRHLNNLHRCLSEWRIAINTSKSSFVLFAKAGIRIPKPRPDKLLTNAVGRYHEFSAVTLDKRLTWSPHIDHVIISTAQRMGMLGPLLNRRSNLTNRKETFCTSSSSVP